jgi:hypothetical protein
MRHTGGAVARGGFRFLLTVVQYLPR